MIKLYEKRKNELKKNKNQGKQSSDIKIQKLLGVNQVGQKVPGEPIETKLLSKLTMRQI